MDINTICRLCLNTTGSHLEIIHELIKEIFDILLIKLNWDISEKPGICGDCKKATLRCFYFKAMCVRKEQGILPSPINANAGTKYAITGSNILCTFCMNAVGSDESKIDVLTPTKCLDMMPLYLPEKDIQSQKNQAICSSCNKELEVWFNFIVNCIYIEETIITYTHQNMEMVPINLIGLQNWLLQSGLETHNSYTTHLKQMSLEYKESQTSNHKVHIYKCKMCAFESRWKKSLERHMVLHYDTARVTTYKCPLCTYETKQKSNLKQHSLRHTNAFKVNTYKCEQCGYETPYKHRFIEHRLVHKDPSEVKMHRCLVCPFETKYKSILESHRFSHATIVETFRYKCAHDGCTFKTQRKARLTVHALLHKDTSEVVMYQCTVCEYRTRQKHHLMRHSLVHEDASRVATYNCTECSYTSKYKANLNMHVRTHTDVPQTEYKCAICDFVTKYKHSLKKHMKMHQ